MPERRRNEPLRVLLVDDEPVAHIGLRALIAKEPDLRIVGEALGGAEAIRLIRETQPDLVFLDVQMPGVDGFGVLRALRRAELPAVIFVTAYDAFAVRAFDVHAVDYLMKPVAADRFARALARARDALSAARTSDLERRLRELLDEVDRTQGPAVNERSSEAVDAGAGGGPAAASRVLVRTGLRDVLVAAADIDWIEADDYCSVLHVGGKQHVVRETLASFEARLHPGAFARVHRSAIVNLARVKELARHPTGGVSVVLQDGTRLPLSRSRRGRFLAAISSAR